MPKDKTAENSSISTADRVAIAKARFARRSGTQTLRESPRHGSDDACRRVADRPFIRRECVLTYSHERTATFIFL
jgi:hypothetical protein